MVAERPKAFVLMPFEPEFDAIYEDLIVPALEEAGYEVTRADSLLDQQNIIGDIVRGIAWSDLIIAELTTLNPNVLYELGIAHALQKPTILVAQSLDDVPFDLRQYRVVTYETDFRQVGQLTDSLKSIAERARERSIGFGNPVTDFLGEVVNRVTMGPVETPAEEVESEPGFLDWLADFEEAMEQANASMETIGALTEEIGGHMEARTEEIKEAQTAGGPGSAAHFRMIARRTSMEMITYGKKVEEQLPVLRTSWETATNSMTSFLPFVKIKDEKERESLTTLRVTVQNLLDVSERSMNALRGYRESVWGLKGISRDLNRASKLVTDVLTRLLDEMQRVQVFSAKVITLIDEKLE